MIQMIQLRSHVICFLFLAVVLGCREDGKPGPTIATDTGVAAQKPEPEADRTKHVSPSARAVGMNPKEKQPLERILTGIVEMESAALNDFTAGIKVGDAGRSRYRRGCAYFGLGKIDEAVDDLTWAAVKLTPYLALISAITDSIESESHSGKLSSRSEPLTSSTSRISATSL